MINNYNLLSLVFSNFTAISDLTILKTFYPVGENSVITHCSNKKLKIPFQKTELGIQCLSYLGPISFVGLRTFVAFLCYPCRYSVFYVFIFVLQQQFLVFSRHDKEINLCNYQKLHQVYSSSFQ